MKFFQWADRAFPYLCGAVMLWIAFGVGEVNGIMEGAEIAARICYEGDYTLSGVGAGEKARPTNSGL